MFGFIKKIFKRFYSGNSVVDASAYTERTRYAKKERNILDSIRDIATARHRIRADYNNNFAMASGINSLSRLAIGDGGVSVIFSPKKNNDKQNKLRDRVQKEWNDWVMSSRCDTEFSSNLINLQLQIANTVRLDGFMFFEVVNDKKGIYVRTHAAERLADGINENLEDGNFVRFGIEYNPQRIKVAYYFREKMN